MKLNFLAVEKKTKDSWRRKIRQFDGRLMDKWVSGRRVEMIKINRTVASGIPIALSAFPFRSISLGSPREYRQDQKKAAEEDRRGGQRDKVDHNSAEEIYKQRDVKSNN